MTQPQPVESPAELDTGPIPVEAELDPEPPLPSSAA